MWVRSQSLTEKKLLLKVSKNMKIESTRTCIVFCFRFHIDWQVGTKYPGTRQDLLPAGNPPPASIPKCHHSDQKSRISSCACRAEEFSVTGWVILVWLSAAIAVWYWFAPVSECVHLGRTKPPFYPCSSDHRLESQWVQTPLWVIYPLHMF